ncbi:transcriptional regulator FtrA [Ramlibacter sp.]|uniref:transcriptional regulator FtrA n=1 Tax=Ramlibacter sp. TaxID=1917967 RepID=UPI0017C6F31A|nr:transcriptional regulator FtrA [Ramlibacter sp.]MBA2673879.1 transcriptional regulator FtrA [Ramlibacter sp.]
MKNHLVAALAYDGLCTFEFGCVVEMFALARPELGVDWYRFAVCAEERGPLAAAGGVHVTVSHSLALLGRADTIIVPGWRDPDELPSAAVIRRLQAAHKRGARIASICSGIFVLAAAGLLDGRSATTHWRYAQQLRARHPSIDLQPDSLYVDEGQILTSAGSAAGLDMMLHLVRRDHGAKVANLVAQRLVMAPHRLGDQAQFIARPVAADEAARLSRLMDWVRAHPARPHSLESLAERAAMSVRTLQRQFREACGLSPVEWLTRERVQIARELLENTRKPLGQVAALAGFGSDESFRRHFRLLAGTSPLAYRKQFGLRQE